MLKVLILQGISGSGKSSFAKELMSKDPTYKRVNRDLIREMTINKWTPSSEDLTISIEFSLVQEILKNGFNCIIDDTNLSKKTLDKIKSELDRISKELNIQIEISEKLIDTPLPECIRRDSLRPNPVGKKVILEQFAKYMPKPNYSEWVADKQKAILVDLDGTLAHFQNRSPFDYSKVKDDTCDVFVKDVVLKYYNDGYDIIVVSGREDSCIDETRDWLLKNDIPARKLFMRKTGDSRKDSIIKQEIYEDEIKPNWSVFLCLDDRNQVVEMYRSLGLKVLQCNFGDF